MRTKTLLLTAAALAAGLAVSSAQVYSQNIVGYITLNLQSGFNLVGNQLDLDGSGTNNTIGGVFGTNLPAGSQIYIFNGTSFNIATFSARGLAWDNPQYAINPGQGFWVSVPSTTTVTLVGQVLTGSRGNSNIPVGGGFALLSDVVPKAGGLQTALGYTPIAGDQVYVFNGTTYNISTFSARGSAWDTEPVIAVGQGFWLSTSAGSSWVQNFTP